MQFLGCLDTYGQIVAVQIRYQLAAVADNAGEGYRPLLLLGQVYQRAECYETIDSSQQHIVIDGLTAGSFIELGYQQPVSFVELEGPFCIDIEEVNAF